jgi:hypothetical protein
MTEPRLITPNMAPLEKFQPGDPVAHITMGDGQVIAHEDDCVLVRYMPRTGLKPGPLGKYDANWFKLHPTFLFHRS